MRKSSIFETIVKELKDIGKFNLSFCRYDLKRLIDLHQKYSVFLYKHSDLSNTGKLTLFFVRLRKINGKYIFKVDRNLFKEYKKSYKF